MFYSFYTNYLGKPAVLDTEAVMQRFSDWSTASGWAKAALRWATHANFITGTLPTALAPKGNTTRAQLAAFSKALDNAISKGENHQVSIPANLESGKDLVQKEIYGKGVFDKTTGGILILGGLSVLVQMLLIETKISPFFTPVPTWIWMERMNYSC